VNPQFWWYVARAAGVASWGLLAASLLWGILVSTRLLGRAVAPNWLLDLHRFLGALSVVFVGVHLGGLVADNYTHFGVADLLVPMASAWKPGPVAWGVVGFYLLVAVEVTSLLKKRLPTKVWRLTHLTSYPLYVLATTHVFLAGTDRDNAALFWAASTVSVVLVFGTIVRVLSPKPDRNPDRVPGRVSRAGVIRYSDAPQA
jgi:DMSO/TMAO reductase YedYZ heme-binding membrane subunit